MLRPIPARILRQTVTLLVCSGIDTFQNPIFDSVVVNRVAVQPTNATKKTQENTEVNLTSVLFIDARRSTPVDAQALKEQSEVNGHSMCVAFDGLTYTVASVDKLFDDTSTFHHWEVGLV